MKWFNIDKTMASFGSLSLRLVTEHRLVQFQWIEAWHYRASYAVTASKNGVKELE